MNVEITIHSFSLWHHFANKIDFDSIAFIDLAKSLGYQGISLSLNDSSYRHLGGRHISRMDRLHEHLKTYEMSLEVDTSDTTPRHMSKMLKVAHRMGATSLRTYTHHGGEVARMIQKTAVDLKEVVDEARDLEITILLENHEDFTGPELAKIVEKVNHPNLKILYDYGNSQMVLEDPIAALEAVLPHVYSIHFKDHAMVRSGDTGSLTVVGVPVGQGFLPLSDLTSRLLTQGLRRFTFENVWAYSAPIQKGRKPLNGVILGKGSFSYLNPPFDPKRVVIRQSDFNPQKLVELESEALQIGHEEFKKILKHLGATGKWDN